MSDDSVLASKLKSIKAEVLLAYWTYFGELPTQIDLGKIYKLFEMIDEMNVEDGISTAMKVKAWVCSMGVGVDLEEITFEEILAAGVPSGSEETVIDVSQSPIIPARISMSADANESV